MPMLLLKDLPKYECLLAHSRRYPDLDPSAVEAFLHLLRASTDVFEAFTQYFGTKYAISQGRFLVMMLLNRDPEKPCNPAELAERAGVARATMTGLIDTLERDELVTREMAHEDRRMMQVRLTTKGRNFLDRMLPDYYRRIAALMGGLTGTERKTLVALMGAIQRGIPAVTS